MRGAHRAGQLLHRRLDTAPLRDPLLHHRALVPAPAPRTAHRRLTGRRRPSRCRRPSTAALPPGSCAPARFRPGVCPAPPSLLPFGSVWPVAHPDTTAGSAGPFPGRWPSAGGGQFAHGRPHFPGKDYGLRLTACQRRGVGQNRRSTKGSSNRERLRVTSRTTCVAHSGCPTCRRTSFPRTRPSLPILEAFRAPPPDRRSCAPSAPGA